MSTAALSIGAEVSDGVAPPKAANVGSANASAWKPRNNPWAIAFTVTLATFMEILDTSIANVSLPHIAGNLGAGHDESAWVLTSYLVSNAIVLPISGWLSNRLGRKRFYMGSVALFTLSSLLCGVAPNLGWLVFFRVIQGIGGGGLAPTEQSILADTFEPARRGMAFAMYGMAVVFAPAIGPTLGGYITDNFSWRWVFFINVPVGLLSLYLSNRMVEDPPYVTEAKGKSGPLDVVGLLLLAIGLGSLEVVLDKGQAEDWFESNFILAFTFSGVVALVSAAVWEWKAKFPIVDLRLYRDASFALCNVLMAVLGLVLFGSTILLPQFLQSIMRYSATDSGRVLSPGGFLIMALMPLVGGMVAKIDPRKMAAFGFAVMSAALFLMATSISTNIDFNTSVLLRLCQAVGLAFLFVPINTIAYAEIPPHKRNNASGLVNLARNVGGDVGIALVTTYVARRSQVHQVSLVSHASSFGRLFSARVASLAHVLGRAGADEVTAQRRSLSFLYRDLQRQATALAYVDTLWVLALLALLMLPLVFLTRAASPVAPGTLRKATS